MIIVLMIDLIISLMIMELMMITPLYLLQKSNKWSEWFLWLREEPSAMFVSTLTKNMNSTLCSAATVFV